MSLSKKQNQRNKQRQKFESKRLKKLKPKHR